MLRITWLGLLVFVGSGLASAPGLTQTEEPPPETRIATISGVHPPHQGFALSDTVPSDKLCLALGQNLASELGIAVHVVCTDPQTGRATVVAECGYAASPDDREVGAYSDSLIGPKTGYLICIPKPPDRFRVERIAPDLDALRP